MFCASTAGVFAKEESRIFRGTGALSIRKRRLKGEPDIAISRRSESPAQMFKSNTQGDKTVVRPRQMPAGSSVASNWDLVSEDLRGIFLDLQPLSDPRKLDDQEQVSEVSIFQSTYRWPACAVEQGRPVRKHHSFSFPGCLRDFFSREGESGRQ